MSLSYLDLLLGTAIVFVVMFGLMNRQNTLPESEGKALVAIISVPQPKVRQTRPLAFELEFLDGKTSRGTIQYAINSPAVDAGKEIVVSTEFPTLTVDFSQFKSESIVLLHGQPPPGLSYRIGVHAEIEVDQITRRLFQLNRSYQEKYKLSANERRVLEWSEQGQQLILARATIAPDEFQAELGKWHKNCPYGSVDQLEEQRAKWARLRDRIRDRSPVLDLLSYALLINEELAPNSVAPNWISSMPEKASIQSFGRVVRYLKCRWGTNGMTFLGDQGLRMNDNSLDEALFNLRNDDLNSDGFAEDLWSFDPQGGWKVYHDLISLRVVAPLSCSWTYAGVPGGQSAYWDFERKVDPDKLTKSEKIMAQAFIPPFN